MALWKRTAKTPLLGIIIAVGSFGIPSAQAQQKQSPLALPLHAPRLIVQKHNRRLMLYSGTRLVRTYQVGLGFDPVRDKIREGDGRTPEGSFRITAKNAKSQFYLSLAINYPNAEDAQRGLHDGLITRQQYDAIVRASREHRMPLQATPLGGRVLIHAGGCSRDWTLGCIALDNNAMRELFDAVPIGTPVRIEH